MHVLISGMPRSGSTLAFNFVREALEKRGSVASISGHKLSDMLNAPNAEHVVNKAHYVEPEVVCLVRDGTFWSVCTIRKPEEAIASWQGAFGFNLEQSIDTMRWWFRLYERIRDHSLVVPFELIERQPTRAAQLIGKYLLGAYSKREAERVARKFSKPNVTAIVDAMHRTDHGVEDLGYSYLDRRTMFHKSHISKVRPPLDQVALAQIRRELAQWVHEDGSLRA